MPLNTPPLSYTGESQIGTGTAQLKEGITRAATAAEAAAGTATDVYISPATAQSATLLDFASPPASGYGSTTPRPVAATTVSATGNITLSTAGSKLVIATGANASVGTSAAMVAGAVTVSTTACSATAKIFYSRATTGGTAGNVSITAQDGTGFTLTSTSATETSTFNWWIINA